MQNARASTSVILVLSLAVLACSGLTPTETAPPVQANTPSEAGAQTAIPATSTAIPAPRPHRQLLHSNSRSFNRKSGPIIRETPAPMCCCAIRTIFP